MTRFAHRIATGFALGVVIVGLCLGVIGNKHFYFTASRVWFGSSLTAAQLAIIAELAKE